MRLAHFRETFSEVLGTRGSSNGHFQWLDNRPSDHPFSRAATSAKGFKVEPACAMASVEVLDSTGQVVLTPVKSQQTTRLGVDGHLGALRRFGEAPEAGVTAHHGLLVLLVDRGGDLEAAGADLLKRSWPCP